MNIQQLQYFLEAARTLNFTRAAETFFISQSAMTQQMKNLEEELGVTLFQRKNRKLSLTDAGKLFVSEAQALISHTREAMDRVQAVQKGFGGTLNIGYMPAVHLENFSKTIQSFHKKYPGVKLHLKRDSYENLYEDYCMGKYDIIFNIRKEEHIYHNTQEIELEEYGFSILLPMNHHLINRQIITQEDLKDEELIVKNIYEKRHGEIRNIR